MLHGRHLLLDLLDLHLIAAHDDDLIVIFGDRKSFALAGKNDRKRGRMSKEI